MNYKILYLLLFFTINCFAQTKNSEEINTSAGLSHPYVYQIYQTKDGYIWVSTNEGLNRFDGYNFNVYLPDTQNPHSIVDIRLKAIFEDSKGRLWISTRSWGLNVFDRVHNKFYHCQITDKKRSKEENIAVFKIVEDADGNLWLGGGSSLIFKIEIPKSWENGYPKNADFSDEVKIIPIKLNKDKKDIKFLFLDKNTLWAGVSDGRVYKINIESRQFTEVLLPSKSDKDSHKGVSGIYKDKTGVIWISQLNEGLNRITNNQFEKINNFIPSDFSSYFWMDDDGFVWLRTAESKLFRIHCTEFQNANLSTLQPFLNNKSKSYKTFIETKEKSIFLGDVRGIKKIDNRTKIFKHPLTETDLTEVFLSRKNEAFVTTGGKTTIYKDDLTSEPFFKEVDRIGLFQSKNGEIWGVGEANSDNKITLFHYSEDYKLLGAYPIINFGDTQLPILTEDFLGNIWMANTYGFLNKFDPKTNQISTFSYKKLLPPLSDLHSGETFDMFQSIDQSLWIATEDGVVEVKNCNVKPTFKLHKIQTDKISVTRITTVLDDPYAPKEFLWFGSADLGIGKLNKQTSEFQLFAKKEGLPSNTVWGILEDKSKNFWVSSNKGIFKFDPKTNAINLFTNAEGLQGDVYNKKAFHKSLNDEMVFGGNNGFNQFNPNLIDKELIEPNVKIVNIEVNNKRVLANDETGILEKSIENLDEIELKYSQNTIKLLFSVLDFADSKNNIFRYQLEGVDENLIEAGTEHTVSYVALPAGNYTFKLFGSNGNGVWNKEPIILKIKVLPPWYATWWAYLLYFSILTYIVYRFYQNQINKVKLSQELAFNQKEKERLAELDQMKTNFFANISHEFRTPLTLILGPVEDLINKRPNDEIYRVIQRNANRLLQLINQVLDLSKLESRDMQINLTEVELVRYFRTLASSFSSLSESKNIQFTITQNQAEVWAMIDIDKVEKIVTNLLSNAFKFTENGKKISVNISYRPAPQPKRRTAPEEELFSTIKAPLSERFDVSTGGAVLITVQDEGIGIDKQHLPKVFNRFYQIEEAQNRRFEGTGIGLALVKELVDVLDGTIKVESTLGEGTTFIVELPSQAPPVETSNRPRGGAFLVEEYNNEIDLTINRHYNSEVPPLGRSDVSVRGLGLENFLLIIDDNADIRTYVRSVFADDYQIIEAVNGKDGLEKAFETIPDLIISDLMMPEMDGFEFCKNLKSDERTSHIPVVMLTAKATIESRIEGFELGADEYLMKPFNKEEIKARVKNLIEKQERLRDYFNGKTVELKPNEVKVNSKEEAFIQKAKEVLEKYMADNTFGADTFAEEMNISQKQLLRKLKALTNLTINEFIRDFRLQRAADLLEKKSATVSEIAFMVGYESLSYFTKIFKEKYGKLPSEY